MTYISNIERMGGDTWINYQLDTRTYRLKLKTPINRLNYLQSIYARFIRSVGGNKKVISINNTHWLVPGCVANFARYSKNVLDSALSDTLIHPELAPLEKQVMETLNPNELTLHKSFLYNLIINGPQTSGFFKSYDLNKIDKSGNTAIMYAIKSRIPMKYINHMIELGADLTIPDHAGNTPLMESIHSYSAKNITEIAKSSNIQAINSKGDNALCFSVMHRRPNVTYLLLKNNSNILPALKYIAAPRPTNSIQLIIEQFNTFKELISIANHQGVHSNAFKKCVKTNKLKNCRSPYGRNPKDYKVLSPEEIQHEHQFISLLEKERTNNPISFIHLIKTFGDLL